MRKSRLGKHKQHKLIELFVAGSTARTAAAIVGVNKTTASYYFQRLRQLIHDECERGGVFEGDVELAKSSVLTRKVTAPEQALAGVAAVWGMLQRNGKLYTLLLPDDDESVLLHTLSRKIRPESVIYLDVQQHEGVVEHLQAQGFTVVSSRLFADGHHHLNSIENFWIQAKRHLRKFNGVPAVHGHLFLKECEWRFNHNQPQDQLARLKALVKEKMG